MGKQVTELLLDKRRKELIWRNPLAGGILTGIAQSVKQVVSFL